MKLAALATVAWLAGASDLASAQCMAPSIRFAPHSGSTLPARGTLYVFVPHYLTGGTFGPGMAATKVSASPAFDVYRIELQADSGDVRVRYRAPHGQPAEAAYHLGGQTSHDARITDVTHQASEWTCSYTNSIGLAIEGDAIALRFDWHTQKTSTILPADLAQLGHVNCLGHTDNPDQLANVRNFDLVALFADGSERRLGTSTLQLGDSNVRLPLELVGRRYNLAAPPPAPASAPLPIIAISDEESSSRWPYAVASLVALLAAGYVARRALIARI